jgi:hypothetical protein
MKKLLITSASVFLIASVANAEHSWGPYHWARITTAENPSFDLILVNSTTSDWDPYVSEAVLDWDTYTDQFVFKEDTNGDTSRQVRRKCDAPDGQVRICNLAYGQNGWLGIAGISIDTDGHIMRGYTKLNDTYFSWDYYNTDDWKQSVTCQELGHDVGLGHQDENFNNVSLKSCMDYQDPPWPAPNGHDTEQLDSIYGGHSDDYNSYDAGDAGSGDGGGDGGDGGGCNSPPGKGCNKARPQSQADIGWGMSLGRRGQQETFMRIDPDGTRHVTFVTWVKGH